MDNNNFDYFYNEQPEKHLFLSIPLFLIKNEKFKRLSGDSKILYGLFLSRTSLSVKNNWKDEKGRVYIIYSIKEIMQDLGCWEQKVNKTLKELKEIGLIEIKRQGINKPNLLYIKNFASLQDSKTSTNPHKHWNCENHKSGIVKITNQELRKSQSSNIDLSNIDPNNIDPKSSQVISCHINTENEKNDKTGLDLTQDKNEQKKCLSVQQYPDQGNIANERQKSKCNLYDYNTCLEILKEKILYEDMKHSYLHNKQFQEIELMDEFLFNMVDVICSEEPQIKIKGELKNRDLVRAVYFEIDINVMKHAMEKFQKQINKITDKSAYIKTLLYTSRLEMHSYYINQVNYDFYGKD